ncbi:hypothetical protein GW17_00009302 [Ensete ventricosum]|nr:hypothetical protein GW17_00009302 [Ensete ventricosum]RZR89472.1 hypothetical protein BHM03_00017186 [Ensete ventricosum]
MGRTSGVRVGPYQCLTIGAPIKSDPLRSTPHTRTKQRKMRRAFPAKEAKEGVGVPNMRLASKFAEQAFVGSSPCALVRPSRGLLGAFIMGAVDQSYLIILLPLWLTIPPYAPTMLVVLASRRAFAVGGCRPYLCQVSLYEHWRPRISGWLPASDRPRRRASCPRARSNSYAKNRSNLYAKNRSNSTRKTGAQIIRFDPGPKTEPMNLDRPITYCFAASSTDLTHSSHPHPNPHELVCLPVAVVCIVEVRWRFSRQDP